MTKKCPCHTKIIRHICLAKQQTSEQTQHQRQNIVVVFSFSFEAIKDLTLDTHCSSFVVASIFLNNQSISKNSEGKWMMDTRKLFSMIKEVQIMALLWPASRRIFCSCLPAFVDNDVAF